MVGRGRKLKIEGFEADRHATDTIGLSGIQTCPRLRLEDSRSSNGGDDDGRKCYKFHPFATRSPKIRPICPELWMRSMGYWTGIGL